MILSDSVRLAQRTHTQCLLLCEYCQVNTLEDLGRNSFLWKTMYLFSGMFMGFQNVAINILAFEPDHWCKVERLENFTYQQQVWRLL